MLTLIFKIGTYNKRKSYTTKDVLLTTRQVKLIREKKFIIIALDLKYKAFIIYVAAFNVNSNDKLYPLKKVQKAQLKVNKMPIKVLHKYIDFIDVFLSKLSAKLFEHTRINNHAIQLIDD